MDIPQIIKEIGRGKSRARHLDLATAMALYSAMLADEVDPLSLGAILIALRIKGEGEEELHGFYQALRQSLPQWPCLDNCIIIPSYNGARRQANATPLLALLLHKLGFRVLLHGVDNDPTRITSQQIVATLQIAPAASPDIAYQQLQDDGLAFITIDKLCPPLARQLDLRWHLGLRNSAHTLAKLISPFAHGTALRLASVSHPEYLPKVLRFFQAIGADALVSNGCEGEVYANPLRPSALHWVDTATGTVKELVSKQSVDQPQLAASKQIAETAHWTQQVLARGLPVPHALRLQIASCAVALKWVESVEQGLDWLQQQGY